MTVISASRETLLAPLQAVLGIVERRHTLPILAHVLLRQVGADIGWTSSDLELQLRTGPDPAGTAADFATTVGARKLADILRALPAGQAVQLRAQEGRLLLQAGRSRFSLQTLPAADFPLLQPAADLGDAFRVPAGVLVGLIEQVQMAMAVHDIRYYLNGLLFVVDNGQLTLVASDGNRLALATAAVEVALPRKTFILPRKTVQELLRLLREWPEGTAAGPGTGPSPDPSDHTRATVEIRCGAAQVCMRWGEHECLSKLVEGRFPDYTRVIPAQNKHLMTLPRGALQTALQRAAILTNEKFRGIKLSLAPGRLRVAASNAEREEALEELEADYNGPSLEIGFNVAYLLDVLADTRVDTVQLALADAHSSVLITTPDRPGFQYVVSPMRL
jgi:DNA polymerase-3 subunit beta